MTTVETRDATVKRRLYTPGPVEVPPAVLSAMAMPVLHHRSSEFRALLLRVRESLADVFCAPGDDVVVVTGSGSAAFEAVLLACVPAGRQVLCLHSGRFGFRWAELARRYHYPVTEFTADAGQEYDLEALDSVLSRHRDVAAVTVVHSETSTGMLHDVAAITAAVHRRHPDALVLVDAVTSLAAAELRPREWGLDAVVSGSQKGVMTPPGLAFAWLSQRAWQPREGAVPSSYLDLRRERAKQRDGQTSVTPATSMVAALDAALDLILAQGLEARWAEKSRLNDALIEAGVAMGLTPLATRPSPALAALLVPDTITAPAVVKAAHGFGVTIAGGEDALKTRLLRPSLLGWADRYDLVTLATALEDALRAVGLTVEYGVGAAAGMSAYAESDAPARSPV